MARDVVCINDVDNSIWSITDNASPNLYPEQIQLGYNIYLGDLPPASRTREQAEAQLLNSPLCPALDPSYGVLHRKRVQITTRGSDNDEEYTATVTWEKWEPETEGYEFLGGSISIQTQTVYRAYDRQSITWAGGLDPKQKPELYDLINVNLGSGPDDDGSVSGVEVPYPVMNFDIRKVYAKGTVNLGLFTSIYGYVGRPNSATWRGFPVHTVRIASIVPDNSDPDHDFITWSFEAIPSDNNIAIKTAFGDQQDIVVSKRGWDYLWTLNRNWEDPDGFVVESPVAVIVDQLTPDIDLNQVI